MVVAMGVRGKSTVLRCCGTAAVTAAAAAAVCDEEGGRGLGWVGEGGGGGVARGRSRG